MLPDLFILTRFRCSFWLFWLFVLPDLLFNSPYSLFVLADRFSPSRFSTTILLFVFGCLRCHRLVDDGGLMFGRFIVPMFVEPALAPLLLPLRVPFLA